MQHNPKFFQTEPHRSNGHKRWITGGSNSGKTTRLIRQFRDWAVTEASQGREASQVSWQIQPACLVFAAVADNRLRLVERLTEIGHPLEAVIEAVTPIGFFQSEIERFWPLLTEQLAQQVRIKSQAPLRLRPETEHELAARLWQPDLESGRLRQVGISDRDMVSRILDLLRLAASSGTPHEQIPLMLQQGLIEQILIEPAEAGSPQAGSLQRWERMGDAIQTWWHWCLERGLITYSILTELYWRYLLPHPDYQQQLGQRYRAIFADDVDEYPAVMRSLLEFFLERQMSVTITFNPMGGVRWGLGADPDHLGRLAERCQIESLPTQVNLGESWGSTAIDHLREPLLQSPTQPPASVQVIQTLTKAQLLRQTAETIVSAIQTGAVQPQDIAIIAPGVDAITRYTLQEILSSKGIPLFSLNSQQPLISFPMVRALLTLTTLVYPGLGRLANRESVAEMLVMMSQAGLSEASAVELPDLRPDPDPDPSFLIANADDFAATMTRLPLPFKPRIDPVRAGLLVDYCFVPDPTRPELLPATSFDRWDRLGYQASEAYEEILNWIAAQRQTEITPLSLLQRAIRRFWGDGERLTYDQLIHLRELMETAQQYWRVADRLQAVERQPLEASVTVGRFVQLLRDGTITANPSPMQPVSQTHPAITLSNIYQYRRARLSHRWQFWLDAGSSYWLTSGMTLFSAPLFLRERWNRVWTTADEMAAHQTYLERAVLDLLNRTSERLYLCHCELGVNGQEQSGGLMPLVNAALPIAETLVNPSSSTQVLPF